MITEFIQPIQNLKNQIPDTDINKKEWLEAAVPDTLNSLAVVINKYSNIAEQWDFCSKEQARLKQYRDANVILLDCLNNSSNVSTEVRSHIEETLLLPMNEIQKWTARA